MHNFFCGKKILIIGGTGTIGTGLLDRLLACNPAVVRVFSRDEYKQFKLQQQYREFSNIRYLIGDVRDYPRVVRAMEDIDYVFHVAAMKHVPACEYNPFEAVQTNIIGTQNVIQASLECGVNKTIFTSTDKAIAPTNTYGASKLMAERLISAAQYQAGTKKTVFAAVRFGNVMGSRGSVIPLFKKQIAEKRSITVTCKEMTRFMMTKKQATELTLKAMMLANGGEVFVLKMPVVRLQDLAGQIIEQEVRKGISPGSVHIEEIGLRPGEKMFEELMTVEESKYALETEDMFIIPNAFMKSHQYAGSRSAQVRSYSSADVEPVTAKQLEELLLQSGMVEEQTEITSIKREQLSI
ncbi:polysaccharide biosynthesis protein [Paenibacillus melissococcoides]|uniref:Polysaccharide biosynthesis protein n=1 Tax=Paenibacillus melissococcoides TaxID=2912268 RepID=A0ABM9GAX2_9BACL|nr:MULTISPECIES: polysaccharide biosynthesis protein [Paenibacillus]MEB9894620.1 polysaccharide biosynthesis protein [Bacillus cereus]CAH8248882.1 polysaccharide biosynthesis protein [Paenibacillus melissococcoides]CAH8720685.1 polysaccharide biosynthesis protein [Paenibacillus melissococcoides]CAH8720956.1 polysaccharide biosynthesis protein [Paenibacillus melissococcoides]GIO79214.1 membrane protein [Paenibacillus dendritiformis]